MTARLSTEVAEAVAKTGHVPGLGFVLVGENPVSQGYLRAKHRATVTAKMQSRATPRKLDCDGSYDLKSAGLQELRAQRCRKQRQARQKPDISGY